MGDEITVGHSEEYSSNVNLLAQQMDSRFRGAVTVNNVTGKGAQMMNQVGSVRAQKRTSRNADTPLIPVPHDARWVIPSDYEWADLIDYQDDIGVRSIVSFESSYVQAGAAASNRAIDDEIMAAIFSETTKTGEGGDTTTDWATFVAATTQNKVVHGSTGLNAAKIKSGLKALRSHNVDLTSEPVFCAITSEQIEDLQLEDQYINYDFSDERALNGSAGTIKPFLGVRFIHYEDVTKTGSTWRVPMWVPSGVGLGVFSDIKGRVSERNDKSYAKQVYTCTTIGATRLEENKVVEIECQ